jgi:hypothetical protein
MIFSEMSPASSRQSVHGQDAKRSARYARYFGLASLGTAPLGAVTFLITSDRLDRLPVTLQWILVALAFASTLYLLGLLVFPWSRPLWLRSNFYNPKHWWGFLLPAANSLYVAFMATWGFAVVSGFLYLQGVAKTAPERALSDPFNDSWAYYMWDFLDAIPVLEIPQTLGWELAFSFTDHVTPLLLLLYKVLLLGPVIATGTLVWRDVRRLRSTTKSAA